MGVASGQDSGDFEHGPWVDMLHDLDLSGTGIIMRAIILLFKCIPLDSVA